VQYRENRVVCVQVRHCCVCADPRSAWRADWTDGQIALVACFLWLVPQVAPIIIPQFDLVIARGLWCCVDGAVSAPLGGAVVALGLGRLPTLCLVLQELWEGIMDIR